MAQCVRCSDRYVQWHHRKMSSHSDGRVREGSLEARMARNTSLYGKKPIQIDLETEGALSMAHGMELYLTYPNL